MGALGIGAARDEIVGRDGELSLLAEFVEGRSGIGLAIEGEAGIGKTTLWEAGVGRGRERAQTVLVCRPCPAEVRLSYASLGDLLGDVLPGVLPELPEPQRRSLGVALLLDEVIGNPPEPRAIAVGFLTALRLLARDVGVLVAVDDAQWLDSASAQALSFAARRLRDEPIRLLVAFRRGESRQAELERTLAEIGTRRLELGPLSLGALRRLLQDRLGISLSRIVLARVHETSGGNPFYGLELARAYEETGARSPGDALLEIPRTLRELMLERLERLPSRTQRALEAVAALRAPTVELVAAGAELDELEDALEPAIAAGILERGGPRLRFSHPLLAAAAYGEMTPTRRATLHRRLATAVADVEERARHLALSVDRPDQDVAARLEDAASHARSRGAWEAAADLAERALRLTPTIQREDAWRRALAAAEWKRDVGEFAHAMELLEQVVDGQPPRMVLSRAHHLLGLTRWFAGDLEGLAEIELAATEADDDALRAMIERDAGMNLVVNWEVHRAEPHVRAALELSERLHDQSLLARALPAAAMMEFVAGRGTRFDLLEQALELEAFLHGERTALNPRWLMAMILNHSGDLDRARPLLQDLVRRALDVGDAHYYPEFAAELADLELRRGDHARAAAMIGDAIEAARQIGAEILGLALAVQAAVQAHCGDVDAARATLAETDYACNPLPVDAATSAVVTAFIAMSVGDPEAAVGAVDGLFDGLREAGVGEPALFRFLPDQIEALIAVDGIGEASRLLDWLEERGHALDRPWALATGGRCRALLHAAGRDWNAALAAVAAALGAHERLPMPFELGRTLLVKGTIERRARRKRDARTSFDQALNIFEQLQTPLWAENARTERARISGRSPGGEELTPTERRVAGLVAEGLSNKEVAARLFITPRTVEGHLTRIYAKLGIRSRAQLAHRGPKPQG